jgi:hypothetical protein
MSRMRTCAACLVIVAGLGVGGMAQAAGIGVRAGTTGLGADIGFGLIPTLAARVGYSGLSYSTTIDETDIDYDSKLRLSNLHLLLDWSPLGPFRLTGGFVVNDNKVDVTGRPTGGTYTINGVSYPATAVGSLSGSIKSGNRMAPYLGIGYGNVSGFGVNFYFDLGVMLQGSPTANLGVTCGTALSATQCSQLRTDVAAEQARLQNEIKNFKVYPVANIGVTIGF